MTNWLVFGGIALAAVAIDVALVVIDRRENRPYQHVLTTVERVDEPEDALRVYHDRTRGVTCYAPQYNDDALNCLADSWLTPSRTDASR